MAQYLLITARDRPSLHDYLWRQFSGDDKVQVLSDRRREERRRRQAHEPERRQGDRRSAGVPGNTLFQHGVLIVRQLQEAHCRLSTLVRQRTEEPASFGGQQRTEQPRVMETHERVTRWVVEGQYLLGLFPGLLQEHEQLKARVKAAEQECDRLEREIAKLRSEDEYFRIERIQIGETLRKISKEMLEPICEKLQKFPNTSKRSPFET